MIFTAENILLIGAILIFSSILISKTGYRFGIPTNRKSNKVGIPNRYPVLLIRILEKISTAPINKIFSAVKTMNQKYRIISYKSYKDTLIILLKLKNLFNLLHFSK